MKTLKYIVLSVVSLLWILPIYLLLVNAITPAGTYAGAAVWWPDGFGFLSNVAAAWSSAEIGQAAGNSLLYATVSAGVAVAVALIAAFATVIMRAKNPARWFWFIYTGTLLPLQIFLAPLFRGYNTLKIYDTQIGMILIYIAICIPFAFFLSRNYLTTVGREITEAAQIDGASWTRMLVQIHTPLVKSALLAAFVFQFTWIWNDLLFGITLSTSPNIRPVMAAIAQLSGGMYNVGPPIALAAALIVSIPTVVLFLTFQRYFAGSLRPVS